MTEKTQTGPIRTIKKYPNRRLYDTHESAYITLEGVRTMVCNSDSFKVVDSRSGEDITRTILLQIICEQETGSNTPCFNNSFLTQLIRSSGDSMNVMVGEFLERSLDAFSQNQDALRQQMNSVMNLNPVDLMSAGASEPRPSGTWHEAGRSEGHV